LDLKKRLGFDDPRFHVENCDLCGNSAFREGYCERVPEQKAFNVAPSYPGYLESHSPGHDRNGADIEQLVKLVTDQVLAAVG
jgi:L-fuculose-phosphate aldolase